MRYFLIWHGWPEESVVMRVSDDHFVTDRYDYASDGWLSDGETFFRKFMNSNDNDEISKAEARRIVTKYGGKHFDD